jgi:hypothetical protein
MRGGVVVDTLERLGRTFDVCVCTFVVETICRPALRLALLRRIHALLNSRGCLIMSVRGRRDVLTAQRKGKRCSDGYITPLFTFVRSYSRAELDSLLRTAGFGSLAPLHKPTNFEPELLHVIARKH